jgi:hypothetical protein
MKDTFPFYILSELNMKQIGFIFIIVIVFGVQPLFAQSTESSSPLTQEENSVKEDKQGTEVVSPSTPEKPSTTQEEGALEGEKQDTDNNTLPTTPGEISVDSNEQDTPLIETAAADGPLDVQVPAPLKQEGKRRIFKIVNDYQLKPDQVMTTLVLISGDATIHGTVTGNVLVIGGDVELVPGAQVKGMVQVVGGQIIGNLESVKDYSVSNNWRILPATANLLMHPHSVWDIRKHRNFRLTTMKFALLLLAYLLIAVTFQKPINAVSSLLAQRPIGSILFGFLMFIVIPVVGTLLILSIVGFPFLLLIICLLVPLALCGKTAIFYTLGSTLLAGRLKPLAVIFGFIPYFMATEIPHVDWVTFLLFNVIGIGISILSIISAMSSQSQSKNIHWSERVR